MNTTLVLQFECLMMRHSLVKQMLYYTIAGEMQGRQICFSREKKIANCLSLFISGPKEQEFSFCRERDPVLL